MNKSYRLIWSDITCTWVAVSEIAKARGKRSGGLVNGAALTTMNRTTANLTSAIRQGALFLLKTITSSLLFAGLAHAAPLPNELPAGAQVSAGQVAINQAGSTLTINQSSSRAAVNWNTFNVGSSAAVNINQPDSNSVLLNRVMSNNPSQIFGHINANGRVYLTNPSGVYFAPGSSVNVGGIVATTHSITDADFMAGINNFNRNGATGSVINEGSITAALNGYVALLAAEVRNSGVIVAQLGTVALAAGDAYDLQFDSNNILANIRVAPSTIQALVENGNAVHAPGGLILLSAQAASNLQGSVVNNSGVLEATGLTNTGGRILLEAGNGYATVGGSLDVSSDKAKGGDIQITGKTIQLEGTAALDATGATGGGLIQIGGSWQNSDPTVRQAITTTIDAGAIIDASATTEGDGGEVVVWSDIHNLDSQTSLSGVMIVADAGGKGGNGGRIETSGHFLRTENVTIRASAPNGENGLWLLDPADLYIDDGTSIMSTLNSGANVTTQVDGKIFLRTDILKTAGGDAIFTLKSTSDVKLDPNVDIRSSSNKLHVVLWSDSDSNGDGAVMLDTSATITSNGGNITIGGGGVSSPSGYAINSGFILQGVLLNPGSRLNAGGGNISIRGYTNSGINGFGVEQKGMILTSGTGNIDIVGSAAGSSDQFAYGVLLNDGAYTAALSGHINITGTGGSGANSHGIVLQGSASVSGNGAMTLTGIQAGSNAGITTTGTGKILPNAGASLKLVADTLDLNTPIIGTSSSHLTLQPYTSGRLVSVNSGVDSNFKVLPSWFGGTVFPNDFASITLGSAASGSLSILSPLSVGYPLILKGTGISIYQNLTTTNANLTIDNSGASGLSGSISLGSGSLIKEGSGLLDLQGNLSYSGATQINAGTLALRNNERLPDTTAVTVASGATLALQYFISYSDTIGSIAGAGNVTLGTGTLTAGGNNSSTIFSGVMSGVGGNLVKTGSGTLTLSGTNTYTGTTTISGGILQIGAGSTSGTLGTGSVTNNTSLVFNRSDALSVANVISGSGSVTQQGSGTTTLSGNNSYTGATTISGGTLALNSSGHIADSSGVANNSNFSIVGNKTIDSMTGSGTTSLGSSTLTIGDASNTTATYSGIISGTAGG